MLFGPLSLKPCKHGWMLYFGPAIRNRFDLYGQYSEWEVAMMRSFVRSGNTVVDVGANVDDLPVPQSSMVGDYGCVYALESDPEIFNVLARNLH